MTKVQPYLLPWFLLFFCSTAFTQNSADAPPPKAPFTDYRYEKPGTTRKITASDLPAPFATKSAENEPNMAPRPKDAWPQAPAGFKVELYTTDVRNPRKILTAPNGDFFLAESHRGDIKIFRGIKPDGKPQQTSVFATGLEQPYGIAFYPPGPNPQYVYIGDTDAVLRFPYHAGDLKATGKPQKLASLQPAAAIGHAIWSSRPTASSFSSASVPTPTSMIRTRIPTKKNERRFG